MHASRAPRVCTLVLSSYKVEQLISVVATENVSDFSVNKTIKSNMEAVAFRVMNGGIKELKGARY